MLQPVHCACPLDVVSSSWLTALGPLGIMAALVDGLTRLTSTSRLLQGMTQKCAMGTRPM